MIVGLIGVLQQLKNACLKKACSAGARATATAGPQLGCKDIDERVNAFPDPPLDGEWPYLWLDATYLKVGDGAASSRSPR